MGDTQEEVANIRTGPCLGRGLVLGLKGQTALNSCTGSLLLGYVTLDFISAKPYQSGWNIKMEYFKFKDLSINTCYFVSISVSEYV